MAHVAAAQQGAGTAPRPAGDTANGVKRRSGAQETAGERGRRPSRRGATTGRQRLSHLLYCSDALLPYRPPPLADGELWRMVGLAGRR